ncbi:MAG: 2-C-methyl-D-erythritol 4-phosphate cytidylyltransferase [Cyclobacteriaceae bacterium]
MSLNGLVIVAAGKGLRMKQPLPKQFIPVAGKPILVHSIEKFLSFDPAIEIVLVLNPEYLEIWQEIKQQYLPKLDIEVTVGGIERYHSVAAGINAIKNSDIVAIHDAVRPCVSRATIQRTFDSAKKYGSGVPVVQLKDSIRKVDKGHSVVVDRSKFCMVQTPQTFNHQMIREAYQGPIANTVTDDATVYEAGHGEVKLVEGDYQNLKITTQEDLIIAEALLNKNSPAQ